MSHTAGPEPPWDVDNHSWTQAAFPIGQPHTSSEYLETLALTKGAPCWELAEPASILLGTWTVACWSQSREPDPGPFLKLCFSFSAQVSTVFLQELHPDRPRSVKMHLTPHPGEHAIPENRSVYQPREHQSAALEAPALLGLVKSQGPSVCGSACSCTFYSTSGKGLASSHYTHKLNRVAILFKCIHVFS